MRCLPCLPQQWGVRWLARLQENTAHWLRWSNGWADMEFFGYRADDHSPAALAAAKQGVCPYLGEVCEKRLSDDAVSGV